MEGDIIRTFRLNPRSQLSIDEYKKKWLKLKPTFRYKQDVTINKIVNEMLQEVGSKEMLEQQDVIAHRDALSRRLKKWKGQIRTLTRHLWEMECENKICKLVIIKKENYIYEDEDEPSFTNYLSEEWGIF